jgi:ParB family chromosome partitioning protein
VAEPARDGPGPRRDPVGVAERDELEELRELPVELIAPNPNQPRTALRRGGARGARGSRWASAACCSRCSCARSPGGSYELIAGERRWRAAQIAGLQRSRRSCATTTTPTSLEVALIENMAREDLNPIEEARACAALVEELGLTREEVGRASGAAASRSAT